MSVRRPGRSGPAGPAQWMNLNEDNMSPMHKRAVFSLLAATALAAVAGPSLAASTVVEVELWDSGASAPMMQGIGIGMGVTADKMAKASMKIKLARSTVKAGEVTFRVTNTSKETVHEMVVVPIKNVETPLPYNADQEQIDEDAARHLGEVAELDPGQSGALTLKLAPGKYALLCDVPGHYMNGMWVVLTVTK